MTPNASRRFQLRGRHFIAFDAVATVLSFVLALALRFDAPSDLFDLYLSSLLWLIPLLIVIRTLIFIVLRLYQRVWRYASVDELLAVTAGVLLSSALTYPAVILVEALMPEAVPGFPRSVLIIESVLMVAFAGGWRFSLRIAGVQRRGARLAGNAARALVVGGGSAALAVIREVQANPGLGFVPVGVLADDLEPHQQLMGLPVLGGIAQLAQVVRERDIAVVLLALPAISGGELRRLVREAEAGGAKCLTVPSVAEVAAGRVSVDRLREIDVEDLLRRAPARIDLGSVAALFAGRSILITGAGGSIGGELARQLAPYDPARLILVGRGENSIHDTLLSLEGSFPAARIDPVILDVRDATRLDRLLGDTRPDVVFHAAAHKHVPFMERAPDEAVATNIFGTAYLLNSCIRHGVERFVLISTDKAVNPTSVMGATKRVAELLVLDSARRSNRRFGTVRFGNVLSSRGSVVPIFRRQLAQGRALTVTHPEVSRYFMTIPEAVQLVIQAAVLTRAPGDTFVLDMGDPVRIADLARDLAGLHGLEIGTDVELEFTGLRPGEKLHEELFFPWERPVPTSHEAIKQVTDPGAVPEGLHRVLADLDRAVDDRDRVACIKALSVLIPQYVPSGVVGTGELAH